MFIIDEKYIKKMHCMKLGYVEVGYPIVCIILNKKEITVQFKVSSYVYER